MQPCPVPRKKDTEYLYSDLIAVTHSMALKCPELTFIKVLIPPLLRINSALSSQVLIKNFLEIITMIMYHYNANQIR